MPAPIVFFDIAGPDLKAQAGFYSEVFGWQIGPDSRFTVSAAASLPGALRQDPAEKVIYLGVADVTAALAQVEAHGGKIVQPRFVVPGVVILGLFADPAGNRLGLVEMDGERPKTP
jgi:predicted enzyme related to lactoylglutathione lyase